MTVGDARECANSLLSCALCLRAGNATDESATIKWLPKDGWHNVGPDGIEVTREHGGAALDTRLALDL